MSAVVLLADSLQRGRGLSLLLGQTDPVLKMFGIALGFLGRTPCATQNEGYFSFFFFYLVGWAGVGEACFCDTVKGKEPP